MPNLSATSVATVMVVGVSSATVAAAPNRAAVSFVNVGPNAVYLGYGIAAVASAGFVILPNTSFTDEYFSGPITGITTGSAGLFIKDTPHG